MRALETSLLDLNKVAFWDGQEAEKEFNVTWSRSRKRLQSDIRQLETSLFRLQRNRILGW